MNLADCYRTLGLRTGAPYDDIRAAYRRLARQYHPDVNPDQQQQAKEKFIQITEAYRQLMESVAPARENGKPSPRSEPRSQRRAARSSTEPSRESRPARSTPSPARPTASSSAQPVVNAAPATPPRPAPKKPTVQRNPDATETEQQLKESSYEQLQQLFREQRFPRAIALVEGLAQRLPNDGEVRQWQAIAYQRWGRYLIDTHEPDKARLYLKKALRTDPRNKALWYEVERDLRRIEQIEVL